MRMTDSQRDSAAPPSSGLSARLSASVAAIAVAQLVLLIATSSRYGYHRDEMYFIVAGSHPALGYPDQPPLVPLICWAMNHLAPGSLLVLRLPSALMAATTTVLAGLVAREIGAVHARRSLPRRVRRCRGSHWPPGIS
jgi:hypothetical protein